MANIKFHKIVGALPGILEANAIYLVKVGSGFDIFATNDVGDLVGYGLNALGLTGNQTISGNKSGSWNITANSLKATGDGQSLNLDGPTHSFIGYLKAGVRKAYVGFPGAVTTFTIKNEETNGNIEFITTGTGSFRFTNGTILSDLSTILQSATVGVASIVKTTTGALQLNNSNATGSINFRVNGGDRMNINASGFVGIGTTSQSCYVDIYNASFAGTYASIKRGTGGFDFILDASNNAINSTGKIMKIGTTDDLPIDFYANAIRIARIDKLGMSIGGDPIASAILNLVSTTKGLLIPRMTTTQRDAIVSPIEGLIIYNTTTKVLEFYNGTVWGAV